MKIHKTDLPEVLHIKPKVLSDSRGSFFESFNQTFFKKNICESYHFVQDNHSFSYKHVLRGLHYQIHKAQGKLIQIVQGSIFDVAVDLRRSSPYFGKWTAEILSGENKNAMWIPPGFAHGFLVLSDSAYITYKVTDDYSPEFERTLAWDDPTVRINWPADKSKIILSDKDKSGSYLKTAETYE